MAPAGKRPPAGAGGGASKKAKKSAVFDDSSSEGSSSGSGSGSGSESDSSQAEFGEPSKGAAVKKGSAAAGKAAGAAAAAPVEETELEREQRLFVEDQQRRKEEELKGLEKGSKAKAKAAAKGKASAAGKKKGRSAASDSEEEDESGSEAHATAEEDSSSDSESEDESGSESGASEGGRGRGGARKNKKAAPAAAASSAAAGKKRLTRAAEKTKKKAAFGSDSDVSSALGSEGGESESEGEAAAGAGAGARASARAGAKDSAASLASREVELGDLNAIHLSRDVLVQWADEPYFDQCIDGFVRLMIGTKNGESATGDREYRVCQVMQIGTSGEPYKANGELLDVTLELEHGRFKREWRLSQISNAPFLQSEFELWKDNMRKGKKKLPGKAAVARFAKKVRENVIEYKHTAEDAQRKVAKRKARRKSVVNVAAEKAQLLRDMDLAKERKDADKVREIENRLLEVEEFKEKKSQVVLKHFANTHAINLRNNTTNMMARQAIAPVNSAGETVWNPFARKPTRPINLWATLGAGAGAGGAALEGHADAPGDASGVAPKPKQDGVAAKASKDALGLVRRANDDDPDALSSQQQGNQQPGITEVKTVHGSVNIGLDELNADGTLTAAALAAARKPKPKSKHRATKVGAALSIEQYKARIEVQEPQ
jgi:hypothetical protein